MRRCLVVTGVVLGLVLAAPVAGARVLRVGSYHGIRGQYASIQAAINAAHPGDWILIGPGDYKTSSAQAPGSAQDAPAGLLITKPGLRLRGMNRNTVVIDGTKPGSARCSRQGATQNFGPSSANGPLGLNGIMVWKADNVWVQNVTVCNFLRGAGSTGNEIWWNGGDGSGRIGGWGFYGSYLTATSTFYQSEATAAGYGIFSSNWSGGTWDRTYTSNFNDSGYYIGACQQACNQTLDHGWSEYNALGYSGTNSGGRLVIENSRFDKNEDGFDTNSQNNSDWPSPQNGACPHHGISPITHTHSCWVFMNNSVYDNNNPNVPAAGAAAAGPVGTGMSIEGINDTVMHNVFRNNGAWGVVFQPYPDTETPPANARPCVGGAPYSFLGIPISCLYDDWNNALIGNTFAGDGFFHNPTNGDFAMSTFTSGHPINCFRGNVDVGRRLRSSPANLQKKQSHCGPKSATPHRNLPFVFQALCDTQVFGPSTPCIGGGHYPRRTKIVMHPLPKHLPTMPNPCAGVPANPWCPARRGG